MNTYTESDGALTRNKHTRPCVGYYHPIAGAWEVYTDSVLCHLSCLGALVSYFVRRTAHAHMSSSALVGHLRTCRPTPAMGDDDAEPACKRRRRDADALATELFDSLMPMCSQCCRAGLSGPTRTGRTSSLKVPISSTRTPWGSLEIARGQLQSMRIPANCQTCFVSLGNGLSRDDLLSWRTISRSHPSL